MELVMDRRQRLFVGVFLPLWFVLLTVGPWLLTAGDLPSRLATHFDRSGDANGSASLALHLTVVSVFTLSASAALLWSVWRRDARPGALAAVATFIGWLLGMANAVVLFANQGHADWHEVSLGSGAVWGATASAFGAAFPVALLVRHAATPADGGERRVFPLGASDRVAWFSQTSSLLLATSTLCVFYVGTVVLLTLGSGAFASALVVLVVGLLGLSIVRVRVKVGERGVEAAGGLRGWPRVRFPIEEIESAHAVELNPWRPAPGTGSRWMLGLGYRGSVRWMGYAAWVLRKGPALELDLTEGRRFWVTVDDADEAAAVVNGLLARRAHASQ